MNTAIEAAKFLIQLFSSTKYECNRQKLQKLILFAHFALLLDEEEGLLNEDLVSASKYGLGIDSVSREYYALSFNGVNENVEIPLVNKIPNEEFAVNYQYDVKSLNEAQTIILSGFFHRFGAYHGDILSKVTTKLALYPQDGEIDYTRYPNNIYHIDSQRVTNFISNLKLNYPQDQSGFEIIKTEVTQILQTVLN